jgi:hypothetical protein
MNEEDSGAIFEMDLPIKSVECCFLIMLFYEGLNLSVEIFQIIVTRLGGFGKANERRDEKQCEER